jgi:DNA-binding CsgD family transcriptional regulator/tetratricopeptide (TPR) repeat protein
VSIRIIGREPELRHFAAARGRVRDGSTAAFIVEGEPGIGKTRLLEELRVQAVHERWTVIDWRCAELDVDRPFVAALSGLDELHEDFAKRSESLPGEIGEARSLLRSFLRVGGSVMLDAPGRPRARLQPASVQGVSEQDVSEQDVSEQEVPKEFVRLEDADGLTRSSERTQRRQSNGDEIVQLVVDGLLDLARSRPTMLLIDDAQWIDNASSKIVWGLAGRRRSASLLTVVAFRPDRRNEVRLLRRGLESQGATNLVLGPLSSADGHALVSEIAGSQPTELMHALHEFALAESGGNPLFITELLRFDQYPLDGQGLTSPFGIPVTLSALITRRFESLPQKTKSCLRRAAALGREFQIDELGVVEEQLLAGVFEVLAPAIDLGILINRHGQLSFQHSIVHKIVQDTQPQTLQAALHGEIARCLAKADWSATRVGEHFYLSQPGPSDEANKWLRAASLEVRSLSLEAALSWSLRALSCCTTDTLFETQLDVAGLFILLGRLDDAEALCTEIRRRTMSVEEEIRFRLSYAALITMTGRTRDGEAMESFEWVRSHLQPGDGRHVELLGWRAILLVLSGQLDEAERIAHDALQREVSGDRSTVISGPLEALGLIAMLRGDTAEALRFSRESAAAYRNHRNVYSSVMLPHFALGMAMFSSCPIHEVIATLQQGLELCDLAGHGLARAHLEPITAVAYLAAGQLQIGRSVIESAVRRNSNWRETKVALPSGSGLAAMVALLTDELDSAKGLAKQAFDQLLEGGAQTGSADFAFWCIANVAEETGDVVKARDLLVGVWEMFAKDASLYLIAPDLVRLLWSENPHFAADVVKRCEARSKRSGAAVDRANALASRGFLERDIALLDHACLAWGEVNWKLIPTRISGFALELLHPKQDRTEIQRRLDLIVPEWELMEAGQPVRVLRERYVNLLSPRSLRSKPSLGPDSLSQAERNVVRLVSVGLTNKEIAKELYISHRTVDTHVSHALAKLKCTSRVQLATFAALDRV